MKLIHWAGLILWRGGTLLVAGYLAYHALRTLLKITDAQLEVAVALILTGFLFLFASVVLERIRDARAERSLDE